MHNNNAHNISINDCVSTGTFAAEGLKPIKSTKPMKICLDKEIHLVL